MGTDLAVLRYVDLCPGLPCRARIPFPAERRPKFISVTVFGSAILGVFNPVQLVQPLWELLDRTDCHG